MVRVCSVLTHRPGPLLVLGDLLTPAVFVTSAAEYITQTPSLTSSKKIIGVILWLSGERSCLLPSTSALHLRCFGLPCPAFLLAGPTLLLQMSTNAQNRPLERLCATAGPINSLPPPAGPL